MQLKGQGATEYLVLLAVVLIVALVSVALLGFFPGMASDAQITQSQTYWRSMQPVAITELGAKYVYYSPDNYYPVAYLRLKNTGAYPIRITKLISSGTAITQFNAGGYILNITDNYYMAPGEETYFGTADYPGLALFRLVSFGVGGYNGLPAKSACDITNDTTKQSGTVVAQDFGFEYIEYLDGGQQITKREIGAKPIMVRCG